MRKHNTREEWLNEAVKLMKFLIETGSKYEIPGKLRVTCGWPLSGGMANKNRRLGECWSEDASKDGTHEIFVSPYLDDPARVCDVLVHEVGHAVVGVKAKHGAKFKAFMRHVGLEGKATSTVAGERLQADIRCWLEKLGEYPHASLEKMASDTPKKQSTRMIKCECEQCGYVARTTRKWIDDVGPPHCPKHGAMFAKLPDEEEEDDDE
jgi:hypothetical protein